MYYRSIFFLIQVVLLSTIIIYDGNLASAADYCSDPVGTLVSIQGDAQSRQAGKTRWQPVQLNDRFCAGDILKVGAGGRAAVTLDNETVIRVDQNSTLNFRSEKGKVSLLDLVNGVLHIFSHRPRSLKVITPYVNGIVEGTEFLVSADDRQSVITVFEGHVRAENARGALELSSGQSASATGQTAPSYAAVIAPRDAVQWTLYYPSLLDPTLPGVDPEATGFLRTVDDYLTTGRVAEAKRILTEVLKDDQHNSDALALLSIIAVVQNNKEDARELAQRAFDLSPGSAVAGLALSYTEQADFKIERALRILQETAGKNPGDAQVLTRLAELQLSVGELEKALDTALEAVKLSSNIGRVHAVLGFVQLAGMETGKAESSFRQAIVLDQALPLARLGMGLAYIRNGDLIAGRAEIEIAAALDPGNSMIRSYLGKAYFEEKRDSQSHRQYLIARELDPADPTPWFYDAIRKQTVNRPVEALYDLQKSIELNDNRAVFRSRFLLDDDLAARSSSLGRLFHDLGFQRLALTEGWKSVSANPGNFSAHRFLSDSYRILPRHEIARVSELLQAQLLQPINISPVQPQLAESNLTLLDGAGPGRASYNEYNPLFLRNRLALQVSGIAGSNDSLGDELIHSAVWDNLSYSLGQYYYRTDGIRENNDRENTIYNVYLQGMLSPRTSPMSEFRFKDSTFGDTLFSFEPTDFSPTIRQS
ncbi:MAG: tetratricopeptide repeat protein, partial [Desulfocapsaceae bacterium]|nr:tetratricopeptide repeat protein [Desulfocapsaceae bacterium]